MHKNVLTLPLNFRGSGTDDKPIFPRQKTLHKINTDFCAVNQVKL